MSDSPIEERGLQTRLIRRIIGLRPNDRRVLSPLLIPLAVALLSVLVLVGQNPNEGIRIGNLVIPLVFAATIGHVNWLAARFITGDPHRRGLLAGFGTAVMLLWGYAESTLAAVGVGGATPLGWTLVATVAAVCLGLILKLQRGLLVLSYFLRASLLALLVLSAAQASIVLLNVPPGVRNVPDRSLDSVSQARLVDDEGPRPNVYFLILDGYTSPAVLEDQYDLDISEFILALEDLGFFVPIRGKTNYTTTYLSIPSMMELSYVHDDNRGSVSDSMMSSMFDRMHNNRTTSMFREAGYRISYVRSSYPPMNQSPVADYQFPQYVATDFERMWFGATVVPAVVAAVCRATDCRRVGLGFSAEGVGDYVNKMEYLANIEGRNFFTYAHIMLPHEPFMFDSECNEIEGYLPRIVSESNESRVIAAYRDQVHCLNSMLLTLVENIVSDDEGAVVILQSDHGFGRFGLGWDHRLGDVDPDRLTDRVSVFSAYRVPGMKSRMPESITTVNALRSVWSHVLGVELKPVRDRTFWASYVRNSLLEEVVLPSGRGDVR